MRTFHIGGAAQGGAEQSSVEAAFDSTVSIRNRNVVIDSEGRPVVMARNTEIVLLDDQGPRTGELPCALRCEAVCRRRKRIEKGPAARRMGPVPRCRSSPRRRASPTRTCRSGRRGFDARRRRRGDRDLLQDRHRLEATAQGRRSPARGSRCVTRRARSSNWPLTGPRRATPVRRCDPVGRSRQASRPATCWPVFRASCPRPATSPAACRGSPSCSKPASRRILRSSARSPAGSSSVRTTRPSAVSSFIRWTAQRRVLPIRSSI